MVLRANFWPCNRLERLYGRATTKTSALSVVLSFRLLKSTDFDGFECGVGAFYIASKITLTAGI